MGKHGGFPYRAHRCIYCQKLAVTYPGGHALCADHAADPNGDYYSHKAITAEMQYRQSHSEEDWHAFCKIAFNSNGKSPDDYTWKEIANIIESELNRRE